MTAAQAPFVAKLTSNGRYVPVRVEPEETQVGYTFFDKPTCDLLVQGLNYGYLEAQKEVMRSIKELFPLLKN